MDEYMEIPKGWRKLRSNAKPDYGDKYLSGRLGKPHLGRTCLRGKITVTEAMKRYDFVQFYIRKIRPKK